MKNIFYIIPLLFLFINCSKNSFEENPVEKVWKDPNIEMEKLKEELLNQENGWEFKLEDGLTKAIFFGHINFDSDTEISFLTDYSKSYYKKNKGKIIFSIKNNKPTFYFPKTTRFAQLLEHSRNLDSLYILNRIDNDTIFFDGHQIGTKFKLFKSTNERKQALMSNNIEKNRKDLIKTFEMKKYFFYLKKGEHTFDIKLDTFRKEFIINHGTNTDFKLFISKYYFDHDGIVLNKTFNVNGVEIKKLKPINIQADFAEFEDGITITNESKPKIYDLSITKDFHGHIVGFGWGSYAGFGTRDKRDIANIRAMPELNVHAIFPTLIIQEDAERLHGMIVFINRAGGFMLGAELQLTNYTEDGRVVFTKYVIEDDPKNPLLMASKAILTPILYNKEGFYIIRNGAGVDLVDARDALTWGNYVPVMRKQD